MVFFCSSDIGSELQGSRAAVALAPSPDQLPGEHPEHESPVPARVPALPWPVVSAHRHSPAASAAAAGLMGLRPAGSSS
eukprot:2915734-Pyramimonas_sp.AAC.1